MGGFDSYAFQIRVDMGSAPLDQSTLDRLQAALAEAAPAWGEKARLARLGRWSIGDRFDIRSPGSLDEVIQANRPGGARAKPTVGLDGWSVTEMHAVLTGADSGASIDFFYTGSPNAGEDASITHLVVETIHREIDGQPAGKWIERLFRAICQHITPPRATAASLGERMSAERHRASKAVEWLTYLGADAARTVGRDTLATIPKVDVEDVAGGLLIRLDPAPGPRRGSTFWERHQAVAAAIDSPKAPRFRLPFGLGRRSESPFPPGTAFAPAAPVKAAPPRGADVPRPELTIMEQGIPHYRGARYERTRIAQLGMRTPGAILEGFEAVRCEFDNVSIGSTKDGEEPVYVRDCALTRCRASVAFFGLVVVEDSVIDGLSGSFWPTPTILCRHVVLRGSIDAIDLRSPRQLDAPGHGSMRAVHDAFYRSVDWALDIRDARFRRCDISGIPGHLVRRDPATQVLVTRERAMAGPWREVTGDHFWWVGIERLIETGDRSHVFVACRRGKDFDKEIELIRRLREAGIAEPD